MSRHYHPRQVTAHKTNCLQLFYIAEYFYSISAMFIKCSIAVTLLRIAPSDRRFTWSLWAIIGATCIAALAFVIGIANICMCNLLCDETSLLTNIKAIQLVHCGVKQMVHATSS
jgi:hypothetical protein